MRAQVKTLMQIAKKCVNQRVNDYMDTYSHLARVRAGAVT